MQKESVRLYFMALLSAQADLAEFKGSPPLRQGHTKKAIGSGSVIQRLAPLLKKRSEC
jgi:hypothetical protein